MRITPHDAWKQSDADFDRHNYIADVFRWVLERLRGMPWNFDRCVIILEKDGYEPEIIVHNASRSESMVLCSKACEMQHSTREAHKENTKRSYPPDLYADIAPADEWQHQ